MKRIVVIGAGFGGLEATVELAKQFRHSTKFEILLISDQNYFMFTPLLPQIVSSYINPRHIVQAIRDIRGKKNFRFLRDRVESVDVAGRQLCVTSGPIAYDYLVVAVGSRTEYYRTPGAREYSMDLKSLEDGVVLRDRILDICEHADHTTDPDERK
ncbi:MAG: FAD-dependent oxidoreductase, partial [Candidatus Acidiferrales bacterium]